MYVQEDVYFQKHSSSHYSPSSGPHEQNTVTPDLVPQSVTHCSVNPKSPGSSHPESGVGKVLGQHCSLLHTRRSPPPGYNGIPQEDPPAPGAGQLSGGPGSGEGPRCRVPPIRPLSSKPQGAVAPPPRRGAGPGVVSGTQEALAVLRKAMVFLGSREELGIWALRGRCVGGRGLRQVPLGGGPGACFKHRAPHPVLPSSHRDFLTDPLQRSQELPGSPSEMGAG